MKKSYGQSFLKRVIALWRRYALPEIPVHAAGAGYFIVLSIFPMLVLLLGLLRYTGLSVDTLTGLLEGLLPQALLPSANRLIRSAYQNTSGTVVSLSALAALWSASRGIYGLMRGLNAVYHRQENRSWFHVRWLSVLYTCLFLGVVLASLFLGVFETEIVRWLPPGPAFQMLERSVLLRYILQLALQTGLFCGMFMVLPSKGNPFHCSLPGALLASAGWLIFSDLYSWYVTHFTGYANIFGSVYAVALSMLWLYSCLCILFFGGGLNHHLYSSQKKMF